jgi:hypothetical protein
MQLCNVPFRPGQQVVDAGDGEVALKQRGAQVRPDKPGASGNNGVQLAILREE